MRIRNVDKNWDWKFGHSKTDYVRTAYAIALDIKMSLLEWYQDCFFQKDAGIPWDIRLGEKNQKKLLDDDIKQTVQNVEGVLAIEGFKSTLDNRRYKCSFNVFQPYSDTALPITFDTQQGVNING